MSSWALRYDIVLETFQVTQDENDYLSNVRKVDGMVLDEILIHANDWRKAD